MQKIKDILTPGDHHNTATGTTTGTAYNAGTAYNTDPAYGAGTGVGTGTHGAHGTAAHDPNHPGMMQKLKDAVTPAGHHNDVPMYANTAGTTMGAGHNAGNTYGTGMQPSGLGTADYGTGTGVGTGNMAGTGYNTAYGTDTAAHKPTMMEKVKDALPGHHNTTTGTGAYNTDQAYGTGTAQNKPSMMDKVKNALPGHRHKTRYNADGTIMRRNSNSSSSSSSDDEGRRGDAVNVRKFTEVEDRPVLKERVEQYVEHVPVEKQFVVETRPVGEKVNSSGMTIEHKGVRENIIDRVTGQPGPAPGMIEKAMGAGQGTTY